MFRQNFFSTCSDSTAQITSLSHLPDWVKKTSNTLYFMDILSKELPECDYSNPCEDGTEAFVLDSYAQELHEFFSKKISSRFFRGINLDENEYSNLLEELQREDNHEIDLAIKKGGVFHYGDLISRSNNETVLNSYRVRTLNKLHELGKSKAKALYASSKLIEFSNLFNELKSMDFSLDINNQMNDDNKISIYNEKIQLLIHKSNEIADFLESHVSTNGTPHPFRSECLKQINSLVIENYIKIGDTFNALAFYKNNIQEGLTQSAILDLSEALFANTSETALINTTEAKSDITFESFSQKVKALIGLYKGNLKSREARKFISIINSAFDFKQCQSHVFSDDEAKLYSQIKNLTDAGTEQSLLNDCANALNILLERVEELEQPIDGASCSTVVLTQFS